ncbi:unnamed protein product [Clonostachys rosea]|uniref:protein O-GlcNAc transferase n=1 Tax=Bionectria ochroleuca TaxID=29856 RepID=A0ABY6URU7_BIOOC|nr:unnamed protein product [Clonostachys rosea]
MIPLLQIQPGEVPRPTNIDAHVQFHDYTYPPASQMTMRENHLSQHPYAFPIRTSQSQRRATPSSNSLYPPRSEFHLRRKTPNGTIEAAYDGSPGLPNPGPPHKHMIVPAAAQSIPRLRNSTGFLSHPQTLDTGTSASLGQSRYNADAGSWHAGNETPAPYALHDLTPSNFNAFQPTVLGAPAPFASFPNDFQPVLRANEYNVRAFCPPPMPSADFLPFGQAGWQPGAVPWSPRFPGPFDYQQGPSTFPGHGAPISGMNGHGTLGPANPPYVHDPLPVSHMDAESSTSGSQGVVGHPGRFDHANEGLPRFRERALGQAHSIYLELIAVAQTARKSIHPRTGTGPQESSKLFVFPKPPNPISNPATMIARKNWGGHVPSFQPSHHSMPQFTGQYSPTSNVYPGSPSDLAVQTGQQVPGAYLGYVNNLDFLNRSSPHARAQSSLDVLKSLCEQSGWKWVDGMLMGGCLHYGQENYQEALQWFSRISAVDSSNYVALTNVAAALYCLGRQEEAEKTWLRVVRLHPAYLEAAEHLVGLLYRKRSLEAIEVISFVQKALKTPSQDPAKTTAPIGGHLVNGKTESPIGNPPSQLIRTEQNAFFNAEPFQVDGDHAKNFGSSGYALPDSENGRMLALVHAKGTMLYSLKDIERASKAFEEAVLISVGRHIHGIRHLVQRIQTVLSHADRFAAQLQQLPQLTGQPLLLPPEKVRHTAQMVFPGTGQLPGLVCVPDGPPKRAATQTTSNSLLSLAKIFQDAMSSGVAASTLPRHTTGVGDILALYYLSFSLQESPSTANNVGILLAGVQQAVSSASTRSLTPGPQQHSIPGVPPGSGLALALAYYQHGLRLDPKHVHLHTNLGSLLKDIGQLDLAIQMYEQAVSCDPTFDIALTNLANAVKDRGRINEAITYYKRAVKSNPDFAEAVCGLFTALSSVCNWKGRGGVLLENGKFDRWHVDEEGMLQDSRTAQCGSGLTKRVVDIVRHQLGEASRWGVNSLQDDFIHVLVKEIADVSNLNPEDIRHWLYRWKGKPWEGSILLRLVERLTRFRLWVWYHDRYISKKKSISGYSRVRLPPRITVPSTPTVLPFHTFTCPLGPKDIRTISQRNAVRISCTTLRAPWLPKIMYPPPPPPSPHLNVGYLSSDFNNHPLAHLMQSVFGFHDRRRVRAFCYATTASDKSTYRQKIEEEAPVFRDVSSWSPDKLVEQIVKDQIHILVNLNGYTRGARNEIFAARPAPIHMSFMGFAGTLGAEWCDYILADSTAIPPSTLRPWRENVRIESIFHDKNEGDEDNWVYSENIIFCRDTFFCCDHAQSCSPDERNVTWEEEQRRRWDMRKTLFPKLSDDTIIMGNFNQLYKIEPTTFRSWLRILSHTPNAVLWLLRFPEAGEANLKETARQWAGSEVASRIIFTDVAPKTHHISRARVCDLFLDTPECNAHTTAADVLWSSTPLLTLPRYPYKMCSRMAASILKGALPRNSQGSEAASELIAGNEQEYEQMACRLASGLKYQVGGSGYGIGHGRLAEIRKLLWDSKWECALFNTRRWVDDVETAYEQAWQRWVSGESGDIHL